MKKEELKATIVLFVTAIIWGLAYIGVEFGLENGFSPYPLLFVRTLVGGVVLLPIAIVKKEKLTIKKTFEAAICGLCGFLGLALQSFAQTITTISNTAFITSIYIMFTPVCARLISKKKEPFTVYLCCLLSVIGCFFLNMNYPFEFDSEHFLGNMLALVGAIMFALQIIFITKFTQGNDCIQLTTIELFSQAFFSLLMMIFTSSYEMSFEGLGAVTLVGVFSSGLCSFFQMYGNKRLRESMSGLIQGTESIFGTLFAILFYNESLDILKWLGCFLVLLGAILGQLIMYKKEKGDIKNGM